MNKKILIIPSWYPTPKRPLNGSFFKEQAEFLENSKVGEFVVLYGDEQSTPFHKLIWIYFLSLVKIKWPIHQSLVIQGPEAYGFIVPKNRRFPEKYRVKLAIRLYQKAYLTLLSKGFQPDLIHAQSGMDAGIYAHDISKTYKIPFVILEHQVFVFHYFSRHKAKLVLQAFEAAKNTAAVSYDERRQILMNQPNCNPIVIPNLVDESKFDVITKINRSKFQIVTFMYANRIKGYQTFFQAMNQLQYLTDDFSFTVVGNGVVQGINVYEEICEELNITSKSEFIPRIKREDIPGFFQNFDVYACSSNFESFGIAPREAMMCGLPVVSTANGGVEDCITPETGVIVPVKDPSAMAKAVLKIKNNELKFDPQYIRKLVIQQCGKEVFLKSMSDFYKID